MFKKVLAISGFFYILSWFLNLVLNAVFAEYPFLLLSAVAIVMSGSCILWLGRKRCFNVDFSSFVPYLAAIGWIPLMNTVVLALWAGSVFFGTPGVILWKIFAVIRNSFVFYQGYWTLFSLFAVAVYVRKYRGGLVKQGEVYSVAYENVKTGLNRLMFLGAFYMVICQFAGFPTEERGDVLPAVVMAVLSFVLLYKDYFQFDVLVRRFPGWGVYLKAVGWIPYVVFMTALRSNGFLSVVFPNGEFAVIGAGFEDMFFEIALFYKVLFWPCLGAAAVYSLIAFIRRQRRRQRDEREKNKVKNVLLLGGIFGLFLRFCSLSDSFLINLLSGLLEFILIILLLCLFFNAVPDFLCKFKKAFPRLSVYLTAVGWYPFYRWSAAAFIYGGYYSGLWIRGGGFEKFMLDKGYWIADVVDVLLLLSLLGAAVYDYRRQKALKLKK